MDSIVSTLGGGSGIDTAALVKSLVSAQFELKNRQLTTKSDTLTAQISSLSSIKSALTSFSAALSALSTGGSLTAQPSSSDPSLVTAATISGAKLGQLSSTIKVSSLATSQVTTATAISDSTTPIGTGTLTITLGAATVANGVMTGFTPGAVAPIAVTIDASNSSLDKIAAKINAANAGVTASVVTDASGKRLALRGATGEAKAFTVGVAEDAGAPGLAAFAVGPGASARIAQAAGDAHINVDGIDIQRDSNSITGVLDGVRLELISASPAKTTNITTTRPSDGLKQAVNDYVSAYNELAGLLATATDAKTGALRTDPASRQLGLALRSLNSSQLNASSAIGAPHSLSEVGVKTNRDGTLAVDDAQLTRSLSSFPDVVEQMFAPTDTASGLPAALKAIADNAKSTVTGLGASETRYGKMQSDVATAQAKATEDADVMTTRLTKQFAGMDARVSAYKATQSFLEQQVAAWTSSK